MSFVWKKIRKIAGKFMPCELSVIEINGGVVADAKTVAEAFANHLA